MTATTEEVLPSERITYEEGTVTELSFLGECTGALVSVSRGPASNSPDAIHIYRDSFTDGEAVEIALSPGDAMKLVHLIQAALA